MTSEFDMARLVDVLAKNSSRPRYTFMVLNLIANIGGKDGRAGPWVREGETMITLREWLTDTLASMAHRDPRRIRLTQQVRVDLLDSGKFPADEQAAEQLIEYEVRERVRASGKTNVSRAVSDLVRAGLLSRHYQGYAVDHPHRGGQRHAVYTIAPMARAVLSGANGSTRRAVASDVGSNRLI